MHKLNQWTKIGLNRLWRARYNYPCTQEHRHYSQFDAMDQSVKINLSSRADEENPEKFTEGSTLKRRSSIVNVFGFPEVASLLRSEHTK